MKYFAISALVLAAIVLAGPSPAQAQSNTDSKLWVGAAGRVGLLKSLRLDIDHQQRYSNDIGVEKSLTEFELRLRFAGYFRVGAAYRTIATPDDGFWHRGSLNLGARYDLGRIGLSYRLRLQTTERSNETVNAIRNKVAADYDLGGGIKPKVAAELHYSTSKSEFREVRFVAGVEKKLSKRVRIGASYMFQSEFNKRTNENNHVLLVGLTYIVRKVKADKSSPTAESVADEPAADARAGEDAL